MILGIENHKLLDNRGELFPVQMHYREWINYFDWIEDCIASKLNGENFKLNHLSGEPVKYPKTLEGEFHQDYELHVQSQLLKNNLSITINYPNFQRTSAFLLLFADFEFQIKECYNVLAQAFPKDLPKDDEAKNISRINWWVLNLLNQELPNFNLNTHEDFCNRMRILRNSLVHQFGFISETFVVNKRGELEKIDLNNKNIIGVINDLPFVSIEGRHGSRESNKKPSSNSIKEELLFIRLEKKFLGSMAQNMEFLMDILVTFTQKFINN